MNWRIVVPVVVLLGAMGYFIYCVVTSPAYHEEEKATVVLQHFCKALLEKRDIKKASQFCSRAAAQQSRRLLIELAQRQKSDPNFRLDQFRIKPPPAVAGRQRASVSLIDGNRNVFLILDCTLQQFPDKSWKITDLTWRPLVIP